MSEPPVTVKLFAALRDAAGTSDVDVAAPTTPADVIEQLCARFGERFAQRVRLATVHVDGEPVEADSTAPIAPGAEVALLPPFAGGAGWRSLPYGQGADRPCSRW